MKQGQDGLAGFIYAPYIPLVVTPVFNTEKVMGPITSDGYISSIELAEALKVPSDEEQLAALTKKWDQMCLQPSAPLKEGWKVESPPDLNLLGVFAVQPPTTFTIKDEHIHFELASGYKTINFYFDGKMAIEISAEGIKFGEGFTNPTDAAIQFWDAVHKLTPLCVKCGGVVAL